MHIAIIGCGEVGGAYARALRGKAELALYDIKSAGPPLQLASELGLPLRSGPGDWLRPCDFAIAAVPGRASSEAAGAALPFVAERAIYVDVSTAAPGDLAASATRFEAADRAFVDTAIMSAIAIAGARAPVLLAGRASAEALEPFRLMGAPTQILEGGRPGEAVALKLLRSVVTKGLECIAVESMTAAEHLGVRPRLMELLGDLDASPVAEFMEALVTTHILHAERRMHEMEESAAQLRELGFDAAVTTALRQRYRATLRARDEHPPAPNVHESIDAALGWLIQACRPATK